MPMVVLIEHPIQPLDIARAMVMNRCTELHKLLVPRFNLAGELTRIVAIARLAEQSVLLFYYLIVPRQSVQKPGAAGDYSSIDEPSPLTRSPADHIHLFERENEHRKIA